MRDYLLADYSTAERALVCFALSVLAFVAILWLYGRAERDDAQQSAQQRRADLADDLHRHRVTRARSDRAQRKARRWRARMAGRAGGG